MKSLPQFAAVDGHASPAQNARIATTASNHMQCSVTTPSRSPNSLGRSPSTSSTSSPLAASRPRSRTSSNCVLPSDLGNLPLESLSRGNHPLTSNDPATFSNSTTTSGSRPDATRCHSQRNSSSVTATAPPVPPVPSPSSTSYQPIPIPTSASPTIANPLWTHGSLAADPASHCAQAHPITAPSFLADNSSSQSSSSSSLSFGIAESPVIPSPLVIRSIDPSRRSASVYGGQSEASCASTAIPPIYSSIAQSNPKDSATSSSQRPHASFSPHLGSRAINSTRLRTSLRPNDSPALDHRRFVNLQPNDSPMPSSIGADAVRNDNQNVDLSQYLQEPIDQQSSLSSVATASPSLSFHAPRAVAAPSAGVHPPSPPPSCQASGHASPQTLAASMTIDGRFILPSNPPTPAAMSDSPSNHHISTRFATLTTPPSSSPMVNAGGPSNGHISVYTYESGSMPEYRPISAVRGCAGGAELNAQSAGLTTSDFLESAPSVAAIPFTPPVGRPSHEPSRMPSDVPAGARFWVSPSAGKANRNAPWSEPCQQQHPAPYFDPVSSSMTGHTQATFAHDSRPFLITPPQHPSESQSALDTSSIANPPWFRSVHAIEQAQSSSASRVATSQEISNDACAALPALLPSIHLSGLPPSPRPSATSASVPATQSNRRKRSVSSTAAPAAAPPKRQRKNTPAPAPAPAPALAPAPPHPSTPSSAARDSEDDVVIPTAGAGASGPPAVADTIVDAHLLAAAVESAKQAAAEHGVKEYPCSICGKTFSRVYNLKSHMKSHSSVKPFACSFCPKSFARRQDKIRHERIHTKERPFRCTRCDASFSRHDALSRHEFTCSMAAAAAMGPEGDAAAKAYAARLKSRAGRRHSVFMANVAQAQAQAAAAAMGLPPPPLDPALATMQQAHEGDDADVYQRVDNQEADESRDMQAVEDESLGGGYEGHMAVDLAGPQDEEQEQQQHMVVHEHPGERVERGSVVQWGGPVATLVEPSVYGDPAPDNSSAMQTSPMPIRDVSNPIDFGMSISAPLNMPSSLDAAMSTLATVSQLQLDAQDQAYHDHFSGMVDSLDRHLALAQQQSDQLDHQDGRQQPPQHLALDEYIISPMGSPQPGHVMSSALPPFPGSVHGVTPSPLVHGTAVHSMYTTSPPTETERPTFSPFHFPASSGVSLADPTTTTMGFGGDLTSPIISPLLRHPNAGATPIVDHSRFVNGAFMTSPPLPAAGGRLPAYTQFAYGGDMAGPDSLVSPIIIHQARGATSTPQNHNIVPGSILSAACTPLLGYNGSHTDVTPASQSIAPAAGATSFVVSPGRSGSDTSFGIAMSGSASDGSTASLYGMAGVDTVVPGAGLEGSLDGGMAAAVAALGTAIGIDPSMCSPLVNQRARGGT